MASLAAFLAGPGGHLSFGQSAELVIRYYDHAQLPADVMTGAIANATDLFVKINIRLRWVDACAERSPEHPVCGRSEDANRSIRVIILPNPEVNLRAQILAHALFPLNLNNGQVVVFYDRIAETANSVSIRGVDTDIRHAEALVLGHTIAHELGHLLLASPQHSSYGVMKASLNMQEWRLALQGQLGFTSEQQRRIVTNVKTTSRAALLTMAKVP